LGRVIDLEQEKETQNQIGVGGARNGEDRDRGGKVFLATPKGMRE